jgi:hypothetical protein
MEEVQQRIVAGRMIDVRWVGFAAMFRGVTEIVMAFEVRRAHERLAT